MHTRVLPLALAAIYLTGGTAVAATASPEHQGRCSPAAVGNPGVRRLAGGAARLAGGAAREGAERHAFRARASRHAASRRRAAGVLVPPAWVPRTITGRAKRALVTTTNAGGTTNGPAHLPERGDPFPGGKMWSHPTGRAESDNSASEYTIIGLFAPRARELSFSCLVPALGFLSVGSSIANVPLAANIFLGMSLSRFFISVLESILQSYHLVHRFTAPLTTLAMALVRFKFFPNVFPPITGEQGLLGFAVTVFDAAMVLAFMDAAYHAGPYLFRLPRAPPGAGGGRGSFTFTPGGGFKGPSWTDSNNNDGQFKGMNLR